MLACPVQETFRKRLAQNRKRLSQSDFAPASTAFRERSQSADHCCPTFCRVKLGTRTGRWL